MDGMRGSTSTHGGPPLPHGCTHQLYRGRLIVQTTIKKTYADGVLIAAMRRT